MTDLLAFSEGSTCDILPHMDDSEQQGTALPRHPRRDIHACCEIMSREAVADDDSPMFQGHRLLRVYTVLRTTQPAWQSMAVVGKSCAGPAAFAL